MCVRRCRRDPLVWSTGASPGKRGGACVGPPAAQTEQTALAASAAARSGATDGCRVRVLDFTGCTLGAVGARAVTEMMQHMPALEALLLGGRNMLFEAPDADEDDECVNVGAHGATHVILSLGTGRWSRMRELDLQHNGLTGACGPALEAALRQLPKLRVLDVRCNRLGDEGVTKLCAGLASCVELEMLILYSNEFGNAGAHAVAEALRSLPALQQLCLYRNSIGSQGLLNIISSLHATPQLLELYLGDNYESGSGAVGDAVAAAMACALPSLRALQVLDLCELGVGDSGATALAETLFRDPSPSLVLVDLAGNEIGDEGAQRLVESALRLPVLRRLNLGGNSVVDSGALQRRFANAVAGAEALSV